jgi:hypothetical protein
MSPDDLTGAQEAFAALQEGHAVSSSSTADVMACFQISHHDQQHSDGLSASEDVVNSR